ncbi:serine hydrolase domain-containing protein [Pararhodonellum marinum]|uniref:serine hydrolase domain-containing protein n=1 Tax=Pararhodonellum marinum TaxID=2755358 RepID=UPI00188EFD71|nr:serine hydrolase domain-containing protein [Pararhodonellum marinum]
MLKTGDAFLCSAAKILIYFFLLGVVFFWGCNQESSPNPAPSSALYFPPLEGTQWDTIDPEALGWNTSELEDLLLNLELKGTRAFLLLKDGKIVVEAYFGQNLIGNAPFTRDTPWYWASAGKTLTAFTVGLAQEAGSLSINDPTYQYLGEGWTSLTPSQEAGITIFHQLNMTTGLDDSGNLDGTSPADLQYLAAPGTRWSYHNAPYTLLEKVVSEAVGSPFTQYFSDNLAKPIGMNGQWVWVGDNHVYFSNARSMARFGLLMLAEGKWSDDVILEDKGFLNEMINPSQNLNENYGYLWWLNQSSSFMVPRLRMVFSGAPIPSGPADMYSGMGRDGQFVSVVPSQNLVLIRMGDNPDDALVPFLLLEDIWTALTKVIP